MENNNSSPSTPCPFMTHTYIHTYIHIYIYTYTQSFTDPSSAQVRLNAEFVMKGAKLQYAVKSNKLQIT
jgi:hypothetical protein